MVVIFLPFFLGLLLIYFRYFSFKFSINIFILVIFLFLEIFNNFFYFWTCLLKWEVCCLVFASFFGIPFHCKRHKKLIKNKEMLNIVSSKTTTCVLCLTGCVYQNNITQTHTHIQGILIMRRCSNKNITTKSEQNPPPLIRAMRYRKRRNKNPTWLPKNTEKNMSAILCLSLCWLS